MADARRGLLDLFAPAAAAPGHPGLRALRSLLLLHAALRTILWLIPSTSWIDVGTASVPIVVAMRLLLMVLVVASLWPRFGRAAAGLGTVVVLAQMVLSFPQVADPLYLEFVCLAWFALLDTERDGALLRAGLCWTAVIVLFHTGVQKLLHGYYFFAELPLLAVAEGDPFGRLFSWTLPGAEVARLRELNLSLPEAGPLRAAEGLPLIVSNSIWALEMLLPVLIVVPRTRRFGAVAAIVAVLVVNLVGSEPLYGLLLGQLLLLCVPGEWNRRLAWVIAAAYVVAFLAIGGVLPAELFSGEGAS